MQRGYLERNPATSTGIMDRGRWSWLGLQRFTDGAPAVRPPGGSVDWVAWT